MIPVPNSNPKQILSFARQKNDDKVFAVFNFSDSEASATFNETIQLGEYVEYFTQQASSIDAQTSITVPAYGYKVFVKP